MGVRGGNAVQPCRGYLLEISKRKKKTVPTNKKKLKKRHWSFLSKTRKDGHTVMKNTRRKAGSERIPATVLTIERREARKKAKQRSGASQLREIDYLLPFVAKKSAGRSIERHLLPPPAATGGGLRRGQRNRAREGRRTSFRRQHRAGTPGKGSPREAPNSLSTGTGNRALNI